MNDISFTVEEGHTNVFLAKHKVSTREKLVCADNPCPPGSLQWEDYSETGEIFSDCYKTVGSITNCVVTLIKDEYDDDYGMLACDSNFATFSLTGSSHGGKKCPGKLKWSSRRNKCIRPFNG